MALAPGAVAFRYGPDSARLHAGAADGAGLRAVTLDVPELAFDVDAPADLARLRELVAGGGAIGAETSRFVANLYTLAKSVENE
jgi:2-phospho-L-lactate guanylyltransferase (CobY/MobA/RfbA family)